MPPIGPGENWPPRPRQGQHWREPSRIPPRVWRERPEVELWREHAARNGHRVSRPEGGRGAGRAILRGVSGSLTAGLVVLALGLVGVQFWQSGQGQPGPQWPVVIGHLGAAGVALALQWAADRRRDPYGVLAAVGVFLVVTVTLWNWWLA